MDTCPLPHTAGAGFTSRDGGGKRKRPLPTNCRGDGKERNREFSHFVIPEIFCQKSCIPVIPGIVNRESPFSGIPEIFSRGFIISVIPDVCYRESKRDPCQRQAGMTTRNWTPAYAGVTEEKGGDPCPLPYTAGAS